MLCLGGSEALIVVFRCSPIPEGREGDISVPLQGFSMLCFRRLEVLVVLRCFPIPEGRGEDLLGCHESFLMFIFLWL